MTYRLQPCGTILVRKGGANFFKKFKPTAQQRKEAAYDPESTLTRLFCRDATDSTTDFVNQLKPTFIRCSSVGNLAKYASFLAAVTNKRQSGYAIGAD